MSYTHDRLLKGVSIDDAQAHLRASLPNDGFSVLTEIDGEMDGDRILGACNPKMACGAIGIEPRVGAMLPCNGILRETDGRSEISAIAPIVWMTAIDNDACTPSPGRSAICLSVPSMPPDPVRS